MARPIKRGLDYYPKDVKAKYDYKFKYVESTNSVIARLVIYELWDLIYGNNGYYVKFDKIQRVLFLGDLPIDDEQLTNILDSCFEIELFDKTLYEKYQILTSKSIQKRYLEAVNRRSEVNVISLYFLLSENDYCNINLVNVNDNSINVNNNPINDNNNTQSKVNKSKTNESKAYILSSSDEQDDIPYKEIIDYLNEKAKTSYRSSSESTKKLIKARFNDGFILDNFKTVIDKKCSSWLTDENMAKYLRPSTLFGTKFEQYLNEVVAQKPFNASLYKNNDGVIDGLF